MLTSYLPYRLLAGLLEGPEPPQGRSLRLPAAVLFADVSGFTPMSEALGRFGQVGTEELTSLLNDYFEVMTDLASSYGGVVGAFGGDALSVIFPAGDDLAGAAARAAQCALDMQLMMLPYAELPTLAGSFSLRIKIGLAAGEAMLALVGEPGLRSHAILAGAPLSLAVAAERMAEIGQVVAHQSLSGLLPTARLGPGRSGVAPLLDLATRPTYAPLEPIAEPPAGRLAQLREFLHPTIADRLADDRAGFLNEHRSVIAIFVGFDEFDYDGDPAAADQLNTYVARAARVVARYDGDLNKVDMADKGSKLLIVFGAPVAHEDDADRAMYCALALRDLAGVPARIGIAGGLVYCGLVGGPARREYTVMGDTVNLAARLMQAADPGEVLVGSLVQRRSAERFFFEPLAPLRVKGRSDPVPVFRLERPRPRSTRYHEPTYRTPMVGREAEMQLIEQRLELALRGQGQVVGINAEAGMGKSRLVAEVARMSALRGVRVIAGECLSHGVSISYLPWQSLLRGVFGIDPAWSHEDQIAQLREQIGRVDQRLLARLPLLGVALNLPIPDTDLTRSLDARVRKDALETTLLACLRGMLERREGPGAPTGLMLVIEDCHWIDPLSLDLLELLARSLADRPALIILAYRPAEHGHALPRMARLGHFSEIQLREFSLRETEWLIGMKFGYMFGARGVLPPSFVERIISRSQGNPFYIDQMISFIQDQGVSPADAAALERVRLPDSLRALIVSRIDRLSEQEQVTLKVASVIGRTFPASWLWGIYPQVGRPEEVRDLLDRLSRLDLTAQEKSEPEIEYLFKHVVTQEVAYESLSLATRTMLHEQVGRFIEEHFPAEQERYLNMLAHHFGRSANTQRQRHYFGLAGTAAQAAYANEAALDYYGRLLPLLAPGDQIGLLLRQGQVQRLIGRWSAAEASIRQALALAEAASAPAMVARCRTDLAHMLASRGDYDHAVSIIDEVMPVWERLDDPSGHYDALWVLGYILIDIGEYTRGLRQLEHTYEIATRLGDEALTARSIGYMGLVYVDTSDYEMALYCLERGADLAARFSDWALLARTRGAVGFILRSQGEAGAALATFHELLGRAAEIGDRRAFAWLARELGRCHQQLGDLPAALRCYAVQLAAALELGERRDLSIGLGYLAEAYAQQGDAARAEPIYELAITLCDTIRLVYWGCEFRLGLARLLAAQGRVGPATRLAEALLATARRVGGHRVAQLGAELLLAQLRAAGLPDPEAAERIAALDEDWYGPPERAAIAEAAWRLDPCEPRRAAAEAARQAVAAMLPATPPPLPAPLLSQRHSLEALIEQAEALAGAAA